MPQPPGSETPAGERRGRICSCAGTILPLPVGLDCGLDEIVEPRAHAEEHPTDKKPRCGVELLVRPAAEEKHDCHRDCELHSRTEQKSEERRVGKEGRS